MNRISLVALSLAAALNACGAPSDDPATIPVSGKWVQADEIKSIIVNGTFVDPSKSAQVKDMFAKYNQSNEFCGEPLDMNEEQFKEKMENDKFANCTIDSRKVNGNRISETASCDPIGVPGVNERVRLTSRAIQHPDKVTGDISFSMRGQHPSGALISMKIEIQSIATRLGDC